MQTNILVIEDDEDIRLNIAEILGYEGMACRVAPDGRIGAQLAREMLPDLIICDIMMPELNGYEVLLALQNDPLTATIPFVFLTAKADPSSLRFGMDLGADDYLTKPFTSHELIALINTRLLRKATLVQEGARNTQNLRHAIILSLPHELRTPLNGILLGAQVLLTESTIVDHQENADTVHMILESGKRLQRMIENYLYYAQLQLIGSDPERLSALQQDRTETPGTIIKDAAKAIAAKAERLEDLVCNVQERIVCISPDSLKKIVEEIADNAFKFSEQGSQVVVSAEVHTTSYVLTISDQGRGMSIEQIKSFGALMQFKRDLYEQQGSGLGLTIAYQLAETYGGELSLQSRPEQGLNVLVKLPTIS